MRALLLLALLGGGAARADLFDDERDVKIDLKGDVGHRREAVDRAATLAPELVEPLLRDALRDDDLEVRVRAAALIGRRQLLGARRALAATLNDPEPKMRATAADALGQFAGTLDARDALALERSLSDVEQDVRVAALAAIGRLPKTTARHALVAVAARLDDDHSLVRTRAAEVLGRLGDERAVVPLIGRLGDGSREVRLAAVDALATLADPRAGAGVARLVQDPVPEVAARAIGALGRLGAQSAVPLLLDVLERDRVAERRSAAALALGRIARAAGDKTPAGVTRALVGLIKTGDRAAREAVAAAGAAAVPDLIARLPAATGDELAAIVELLGQSGDERATPALLAELGRGRSSEGGLLDALLTRLHSGDRRMLPDLVARLSSRDVTIRRRVARGLSGASDGRAVTAMLHTLGDTDRDVRLPIIDELGRLRARPALPALADGLASDDEDLAAAAARAIGAIGDVDEATALKLAAALERPLPHLRRDAADALARLARPQPAVTASLLARLRSAPAERRGDVAVALGGSLRGRTDGVAREALLGIVEDNDAAAAGAAASALAAMHDPATLPRLQRLVARDRAPVLRRRLVTAIADAGGPSVTRALLDLLGDHDPTVRATAAWSLAKTAPAKPEVVAALARVVGSASATTAERINAAASLVRLGAPVSLRSDEPNALVRAAAGHHDTIPQGRDFLALHLVDHDGTPLPETAVRVTFPGGVVAVLWSDGRGDIREELVATGTCEVELADAPADVHGKAGS